jgi:prepilin signal peptidase PulO-like enzyme (type II secretory pathway)
VDEISLAATAAIVMTLGILCAYITWKEIKKNNLQKDTCMLCKKTLKPEELLKNIINEKTFPAKKHVCKNCLINNLENQNNICPYCKQPLQLNDTMELVSSEWYHPKCAYITKEIKLQKK